MIKGINHLTFSVSELETPIAFYQEALGAKLLWRDAQTAYLDLAGLWLALNVQEGIPRREIEQSYTHLAFTVEAVDMESMRCRLERKGATVRPGRPREAGEGTSLYFTDPDGHLFELHSGDVQTRLRAYSDAASGAEAATTLRNM